MSSDSESDGIFGSLAKHLIGSWTPCSEIPHKDLHWLWPGRVPLGKITLFAGDPGLGKSMVALDIAARVSAGDKWPDGAKHGPYGRVIYLTGEDDWGDTIRPRLEASGANLERIMRLNFFSTVNEQTGKETTSEFVLTDQHIRMLLTEIIEFGDVRLVILDPMSAYLGSETDSHVNAQVRAMLRPLKELAEMTSTAVICIDHLTKKPGPAIYRANGSIAFTAAARATWYFAKDEDNPGQRLMLPGKFNVSKEPTGLSYEIAELKPDSQYLRILWNGPVSVKADDALNFQDSDERSERSEAKTFLQEILADGPVLSKTMQKEAEGAGISERTLRRAARELGIRKRRNGVVWEWTREVGQVGQVEKSES